MRIFQKFSLLFSLVLLTGLLSAELAMSQYFVFGKNRVQYEDFDWRYIQTEHFDIYYYNDRNYHLAQFTAESVESAWMQLSDDYGHTLNDRIPVIIYDSHSDFTQTNILPSNYESLQGIGGVTDPYKNRMTQPFTGDYMDFRRTIQHELSHAVVNDMYYGGSVTSMVANNIQLQLPLWFAEGLAEYLALGWDTQTDMWIRDGVINNNLPDLQQLSGYLAYRGGQSFWNFIEEEYGRSKITEILQRIRSSRSVSAGLVQSTGLQIDELNQRWKDHLERRYFPEVAERQTIEQVASRVSRRGDFGSYNASPAITPQGDRIALISNRRGVFDVVVVSAITGERLKTLIQGEDSPMFEELNVLNPNLSWSPDGRYLALSTRTDGSYNLAIVEYQTGDVQIIKFPQIDAINSTAWSPDGQKIAFDGNAGPYQSIFVYNLETEEISNLTNDVFTNLHPSWGPDSETVYFVSNRGDKLEAGQYLAGYSIMQDGAVYETDIYSIQLGSSRIERVTETPGWSETQPALTRDGRLVFISDKNGIPNIYEFNWDSRTSTPLTDLRTGVMQISITADGSRLAFNGLNEGYIDAFMITAPLDRRMDRELTPNYWAQRRASETQEERVPATEYVKSMISRNQNGNVLAVAPPVIDQVEIEDGNENQENAEDEEETENSDTIDFRNYVFGEAVVMDSTLQLRDDPRKFQPTGNVTEDGRYQPKKYRLQFTPDFSYAYGQLNTYYGGSAVAQFVLSDLLGDHSLTFGSNLVFDLRNSNYFVQYAYNKQRTNFVASFFHQSSVYRTYSFVGELEQLRYRTYGGGIDFQYPLNRFKRIDYGVSAIGISRDFSSLLGTGDQSIDSESSFFLYPQVTYTADFSVYEPGTIAPTSGRRYSIRLSGSPPPGIQNTPLFATVFGDYRQYIGLGYRYSIALRASGAASVGPDSQTFFMGGTLGWINQRWSNNEIPIDRLADTFFTLPATPLRGHEYNTLYGDKFGLINAEFRFPLFAAILPGPIPFLPLYNITGVAFIDVGSAWGFDIAYSRAYNPNTGEAIPFYTKSSSLDFKVAQQEIVYLDPNTGLISPEPTDITASYIEGDILIGAGFGLRTIVFGLPLQYDVGWARDRDGFRKRPIHYFSIALDF